MNHNFTVEESNLISIFMEEDSAPDLRSRANVIKGISDAMGHLEDDEMIELSAIVVQRLQYISDEEFAGLEFIVTD